MNNIQELLRHIKFSLVSALKGPQTFADIKTKDSTGAETVLRYMGDTPQAGIPVTIVTTEGELPAPSGDYLAEDGSTIKVTDGIIVEIVPGAAAQADTSQTTAATVEQSQPANPPTMEPKAIIESIVKESRFKEVVLEAMKETIEAKDKIIADQRAEFEKQFSDQKATIEKQEGIVKQLFTLVEKLSAAPAAGSRVSKSDGIKKPLYSDIEKSVEEFRSTHGL